MYFYILVFIFLNFIKNFIIFDQATKDSSPGFYGFGSEEKKGRKK